MDLFDREKRGECLDIFGFWGHSEIQTCFTHTNEALIAINLLTLTCYLLSKHRFINRFPEIPGKFKILYHKRNGC